MPDGTIITNVPDNVTQSELLGRYQKSQKGFFDADFSQAPSPIEALKKTGKDIASLPGFLFNKYQNLSPEDQAMLAATGASLLAPELAIPQQIASAIGPIATNVAARVLPPSIGGFLGRTTGELQRNPEDIKGALGSGVESAAQMATAEMGGQTAINALGRLGGFASKKLSTGAKELAEFARSKGVPLSPSAVSPTLTRKAIEGGTDAFLPSRLVNDSYRKNAVIRFNQLMTEIPEEVGKVRGNADITRDALSYLDDALIGKEKLAKKTTEEFIEGIGRETPVRVDTTLQALKKAKESAADDSVIRFVEKKLEQFGKGSVSAENLETALRQVGKTGAKSDQKFLDSIRKAIKEDFARSGADVAKLDESTDLFRESFGALKGQLAKKLKADISKGIEPTGLTEKLFRNENEQLLSSLKKGMPVELWDDLRAQNLSNMIYNSSTESKRLMGMRLIDGNKLEKIVKVNEQMLKKNYGNHVVKSLLNLSSLAKASAQGVQKFEGGIGETNKFFNLSGLSGAVYAEPFTAVSSTASTMLLSKSIMNPNGVMNRWLTTGLGEPGQLTQQGLKLGSRYVFSDDE